MFASDIPAWYRAFNELERKPLDALEETLVYDFDRYLRRKGYITERQVEVLRGIARKHNVALPPIPPASHHTKQEDSALLQQIRIPELEKPENAKWLALLIDAEGSLGWRRSTKRVNRIDERWRYTYVYKAPYIGVGMKEIESKETVDRGARLVEATPQTAEDIRIFSLAFGRALAVIHYIKPYLDKFRRLASLTLTLYKHHTFIPEEKIEKVIEMLFDTYLTSKRANQKLLKMTETEFRNLLKRAEELTNRYLK